MSFKKWLAVLFIQVFGIVWAIWMFSSPISRHIAGLAAGSVFLVVALLPLIFLLKNPHRGRWVVFWSALIFLVCSALPIVVLRLAFWGQDFNTIVVGGIEAAKIHAWSQSFYVAMILGHLWDGFSLYLLKRPK